MTKEQYMDMTECLKEDIDSVMDYLEVNYDDLSEDDVRMLYRVIIEESTEDMEDKEEIHRELLEAMYEMAEERPKELTKLILKVKNYCE